MKNYVNVPSKSNKPIFYFKIVFVGVLKVNDETRSDSGTGSISQRHASADPDPHQNVMDPEHWEKQVVTGPGGSTAVSVLVVCLLPTLGSVVAAAGPVAALHHVFTAKLTLNLHLPASIIAAHSFISEITRDR